MEEQILPNYTIVTGNTSLIWKNKSIQITCLSQGTHPYHGGTYPFKLHFCHRENIPTMEEQLHPNYIIDIENTSLLWRNISIQITSLSQGKYPYYWGTNPSKLHHCHREHIPTIEEQIHSNYIIVTGNTSLLWRNKSLHITLSQETYPYYGETNPSKLHHYHKEQIPTMEEQIHPNYTIVIRNRSLLWRNKSIWITPLSQGTHPYYGGTNHFKLHHCHRVHILIMEEHILPNDIIVRGNTSLL